jgi:Copper amine oxidase N-terminal domain
MSSPQLRGLVAFGASVVLCTSALPAAAGPVAVTVNGRPVDLAPPPIMQAGRLFVPLRGVFEELGASVVFSNGQINATGSGHTVSLHVGSQQAFVDGQSEMLDAAPFIVGASVYVPLRFVSQALGALVNYDGHNQLVAIATEAAPAEQAATTHPSAPPPTPAPTAPPTPRPNHEGVGAPPPPPAPSGVSPVHVTHELPNEDASIPGDRPTVQAAFEGDQIDPNSVHVEFDGRDVTLAAYVSAQGFTYTPQSPVPPGRHEVRVRGADMMGATFERRWHFTTGGQTAVTKISDILPRPADSVGRPFTVRGRTAPGAIVTVQVGQTSRGRGFGQMLGGLIGGGHASVQNTVTADASGRFSTEIDIGAPGGATLGIVINATDPETGIAADPARYSVQVR